MQIECLFFSGKNLKCNGFSFSGAFYFLDMVPVLLFISLILYYLLEFFMEYLGVRGQLCNREGPFILLIYNLGKC